MRQDRPGQRTELSRIELRTDAKGPGRSPRAFRFFVSSTIKVVTPDGGERIVVCDADYHVEFVRTDDGWRIAVMRGPVGAQLPHDSTLQGEMPSVPIDFGMGEVRREVYN